MASIVAVGHRVVHGMKYTEPERATPKLFTALHRIVPYDPDHLRRELGLIEAVRKRHPRLPQVACFDTAFHRDMPPVAKLVAIPRSYTIRGSSVTDFTGFPTHTFWRNWRASVIPLPRRAA